MQKRQDDSEAAKAARAITSTAKPSTMHGLGNDSASTLPQVLFVIGPPASGKSTAIELLRGKARGHFQVVDELEIVRSLAPCAPSSELQWNDDGTFEILNRDSLFERTSRELQRQVARATAAAPTLCEFARRSYSPVFEKFRPEIRDHARVLYVHAPLELRCKRNEGRRLSNAENYVPESAMTGYYADDDIGELAMMFTDRFRVIENGTNNPLDLGQLLNEYLGSK